MVQPNYNPINTRHYFSIVVVIITTKHLFSQNPQKCQQEDWTSCSYSEGKIELFGCDIQQKRAPRKIRRRHFQVKVITVTILIIVSLTWTIY